MYTHGAAPEFWDFVCVDVTTRLPRTDAEPVCYVAIDNLDQYEAPGPVTSLGNGAFRLRLNQADRAGKCVHVYAVADGCFPRDAMILPFDVPFRVESGGTGSDLSGTGPGLIVQPAGGDPLAPLPGGPDGYLLVSTGSGALPDWEDAAAALPDASPTQRGLVNLGPQSFAGAKNFEALGVVQPGLALLGVFSLWNTLFASAVEDQPSPSAMYGSAAWHTVTLASIRSTWTTQAEPVAGNGPTGYYTWRHWFGSGPAAVVASLDSNGVHSATAFAASGAPGFAGDGSGLSGVTADSVAWADVTGTPTTIAGYGLVDAQPLDFALTAIAAGTWTGAASITTVGTLAAGDVPWARISAAPNTLAGYGIGSPLGLAVGGTGADLSATGPGVLRQAPGGGPITVAPGPGEELDYAQITANVTITAGTVGSAQTLITGAAVTYDGSTRVRIEVYAPAVIQGTNGITSVYVYDGTTKRKIAQMGTSVSTETNPLYGVLYYTPPAATITFSVVAFRSNADSTFAAGAGGANANVPAFLRITRA